MVVVYSQKAMYWKTGLQSTKMCETQRQVRQLGYMRITLVPQ